MDDIQDIARPAAYLPHVKASEPPAGTHAHHGPMQTVREDNYYGHRIVVKTTYEIEVDGRPVSGHLGVANDGRVHYHPTPNLSYASAVDLVRTLIDTFPDDFEQDNGHHDHPGHPGHGGGH